MTELIAPAYYEAFNAIKRFEINELIAKGGRNSAKSSFVSLAIIYNMMRDYQAGEISHAACFMKVGGNMRDSVYEQMKWACLMLGVTEEWEFKLSPLMAIYKPSGQKVFFRGLDDPLKTKGFKTAIGHVKYLWFEEADQLESYDDIRTTRISMSRKSQEDDEPEFITMITYNPPRQPKCWINIEAKKKKPGRMVIKTTYLDLPKQWLTKDFILEAEYEKEHNFKNYQHVYLGEIIGVEGLCYPQFSREKHIAKELKPNERIHTLYVGCDGGTIHDATTLVPLGLTTAGRVACLPTFYYDPTAEGHKPLDSASQCQLGAAWLNTLCAQFQVPKESVVIVVDSAAQDLVLSFNFIGEYKAVKVPKKDRIVDMRRVQGILTPPDYFVILNYGYIDPVTGQKLAADDMLIDELENKVTDEKTGYPEDGNDHAIDALKYGSYLIFMQGGYN